MKRHGNLWHKVVDMDNLRLAHARASKGKAHYREVKMVNRDVDKHLETIQTMLLNKTFTTSQYTFDEIWDGRKHREICKLPYFPDRIVQHALLAVTHDIFMSALIRDTFQSLPGRGTSDAARRVKAFVRNANPKFALKIDVSKFYPSVNNEIMKRIVAKHIKCKSTMWLFNDIIDSIQGLPIGNYTSQILGNLYLSELDWRMKQYERISGYYRYCDDIVVFGPCSQYLAQVRLRMVDYLADLSLDIKPNWNIYDVERNGVDFVGYVFSHSRTRLRRKIASGTCRAVRQYRPRSDSNRSRVMSYKGWVIPTNSHGLIVRNIEPRLRMRYHKQLRNLHGQGPVSHAA